MTIKRSGSGRWWDVMYNDILIFRGSKEECKQTINKLKHLEP